MWMNYFDFNSLPTWLDSFHAYGNAFPADVAHAWNFTLCAGTVGYRNTPLVIDWLTYQLNACAYQNLHGACDDQLTLNRAILGAQN